MASALRYMDTFQACYNQVTLSGWNDGVTTMKIPLLPEPKYLGPIGLSRLPGSLSEAQQRTLATAEPGRKVPERFINNL